LASPKRRTPGRPRSRSSRDRVEDRELVRGLKDGSQPAFDALYKRYFERVYNFVYLRLRNHADTEEVVQETFTAVFRCIGSYRGRSLLSSWIYGIAKNIANNHIRRARTEEARIERPESEGLQPMDSLATGSPEEQILLRYYLEAVGEKFGGLAEWQTEVFALRHLENLSIREISERTERSSDAIRSSLYRMKRLFLETAEGTDEVPGSDRAWG
jgi:RNA polymerase sigma-70 factor (ECF subfamily)